MAMEICKKCNKEFLTECDPYAIIPTNNGYDLNCGCVFVETQEKQLKEIQEKLKTEFDTGYKLGAKEAKGEIDKLRKEIEEINSYIPNISTKALTTSEKLKIAVDALEFYADLDTGVKEKYKKARQALEKIGEICKDS